MHFVPIFSFVIVSFPFDAMYRALYEVKEKDNNDFNKK